MAKQIHDTRYAYAVTGVRVRQISSLDSSDLTQLIAAPSFASALAILSSKGWTIPDKARNANDVLKSELQSAWEYLCQISPDITMFYPFVLKNDYHNLKAGIKSVLSDYEAEMHFLFPSTIPTSLMREAITENQYSLLPLVFAEVAEEAYDVLVRTGDGQLSDIIIDRYALDETLSSARRSGDTLIQSLTELFCAAANIKTAFRAARIHKKTEFLERAISTCDTLDRDQLIQAASEDSSALLKYLDETQYREGAAHLARSASDFERWCDNETIGMLDNVRYTALGASPLVAFYLGKEAEVRNVRIILAAKQSGLSSDAVRSRIRRLYV